MSDRVPDTDNFSLQDVVDVVEPNPETLVQSFNEAVDEGFDPLHEGSKDRLMNFRNYGLVDEEGYNMPSRSFSWGFNISPSDMVVLPENIIGGNSPAGLMLFVGNFTQYIDPNGIVANTTGNIVLNSDYTVYKNAIISAGILDTDSTGIRTVHVIKQGDGQGDINNAIVFGGAFNRAALGLQSLQTARYWCIVYGIDTPNATIILPQEDIRRGGVVGGAGVRSITYNKDNKNIYLSGIFSEHNSDSRTLILSYSIAIGNGNYTSISYQFSDWGDHLKTGWGSFVTTTTLNNDRYVILGSYGVLGASGRARIGLFKNNLLVDYIVMQRNTGQYGGIYAMTKMEIGDDIVYGVGRFSEIGILTPQLQISNGILKIRIDPNTDKMILNEGFDVGGSKGFTSELPDLYPPPITSMLLLPNDKILVCVNSFAYYNEPTPLPSNLPEYRMYMINDDGSLHMRYLFDGDYYRFRQPAGFLTQVSSNIVVGARGLGFQTSGYPVYSDGTTGNLLYQRRFGTHGLTNNDEFDI